MKLKILLAVLALALAQLVPAASAEEAPRYAEGEAIVVMRGESGAPAAASPKNAAGQSLGLAEGSVIQYFNPIKEDETQTSAASRAAAAMRSTLPTTSPVTALHCNNAIFIFVPLLGELLCF